ncbi:MAG: DUF5906 domain-containing protein [Bacteroidales bacterium]
MNYLQERLEKFQISKYNEVEIGIPLHLYDHPQAAVKSHYFESDKDDNIIINYIDLNGNYQLYEKTKNGKPSLEIFKRLRLNKSTDGFKYKQDFKSGVHIYFTPSIITKYKEKTKIDTLYIVEGEFKAFVADIHLKIDIVGIGGIHNFIDKDANEIHSDLIDLIKACSVTNIVLLFDADCLTIKYEEKKDLSKRLFSFFTAAAKFKELIEPLKKELFFSHLNTDLSQTAKGIDDLIIHPETDKNKLVSELEKLASGNKRKYIKCFPLGRKSTQDLREYFSIDSPESFYKEHKEIIEKKEFTFRNHIYQHNGERLQLKKHSDSDLYMRIGTQYFKRIFNINRYGEIEENLEKWEKGAITNDYIQNGFPDFLNQVEKYDTFCNIPDNSENYKQVHEIINDEKKSRNYNLYVKPKFIIKEGNFEHIFNYLKHIADSDGSKFGILGDKFTILIDYFSILHRFPQQILPVISLVSNDQVTGKTTLFDLIKSIYGPNATILSQELFDMPFNAHYIQKQVIMLDEVKIESKVQKNKIKQMVTAGKNHIQFKGVDPKEIDTYTKLLMASNDERDFMKIESQDVRFWVLKVPVLLKKDTELLLKMKEEIPAFLHFIINREIIHPKEDRGWFNDKYLQTEQRNIIINTTKPVIERDIEDYLYNYFYEYQVSNLKINLDQLVEQIKKNCKYSHSKSDIRRILSDVYKKTLSKNTSRFEFIIGFDDIKDTVKFSTLKGTGKIYVFERYEWISDDSDVEIININDPINLPKENNSNSKTFSSNEPKNNKANNTEYENNQEIEDECYDERDCGF